MTKYDEKWAAKMLQERQWLAQNGLYREEDEHASCGVGLVVSIDGKPSRRVVENGIDALKAVWHRGAVDADGKTGDGAGIHVQIPVDFFLDQICRTGHEPRADQLIAVGQVFLPRTDFPMRAGLPKKEPEILQSWQQVDLYRKLRETRQGAPKFILHDGRHEG